MLGRLSKNERVSKQLSEQDVFRRRSAGKEVENRQEKRNNRTERRGIEQVAFHDPAINIRPKR